MKKKPAGNMMVKPVTNSNAPLTSEYQRLTDRLAKSNQNKASKNMAMGRRKV